MWNLQWLKSHSLIRLRDGFVSADSKELADAKSISADCRGLSVMGKLFAGSTLCPSCQFLSGQPSVAALSGHRPFFQNKSIIILEVSQ